MRACVCVSVCMCVCIDVHVYICVCVYMSVCVCVCVMVWKGSSVGECQPELPPAGLILLSPTHHSPPDITLAVTCLWAGELPHLPSLSPYYHLFAVEPIDLALCASEVV